MGQHSKIGWTNHTFNPWMGCMKVSEACKFCYAEKFTGRYKLVKWGVGFPRKKTNDANWRKPFMWNRKAKKAGEYHRVFTASLADVCEDHESILPEWRMQLADMISKTSNLDWLLLTKRPENFHFLFDETEQLPMNVWIGASCETQERYEERMPHLMKWQASVRFISVEPMLSKITLHPDMLPNWVIIGGESGFLKDARKLNLEHVASLVTQCEIYKIPVFFKQTGVQLAKELKLIDSAGANHDEYPPRFSWLRKKEVPCFFMAPAENYSPQKIQQEMFGTSPDPYFP